MHPVLLTPLFLAFRAVLFLVLQVFQPPISSVPLVSSFVTSFISEIQALSHLHYLEAYLSTKLQLMQLDP